MILDAEHRFAPVTHAFHGLVVQVDVGRLQFGRKIVQVDGKAVILRGDLDPVGQIIEDRLIRSTMAELELEGLAAQGNPQKLMAQADAENRGLADQAVDGVVGIGQRFRIAGSVGQEHPIGFMGQHLLGRGIARKHRHPAAELGQAAQDVPLHPEIESDNVVFRRLRGQRG